MSKMVVVDIYMIQETEWGGDRESERERERAGVDIHMIPETDGERNIGDREKKYEGITLGWNQSERSSNMIDRQTDIHTYRQTYRQTGRQAGRQADR